MDKYEQTYQLHTRKGVKQLISDYAKLAELRFTDGNFEISDFLMDFELALSKCLTERQREIVLRLCKEDITQTHLGELMGLTKWTIQEHIQKAIRNIATYYLIMREKDKESGLYES